MKINVLELDQTLGEAPRHSLSKTKADLLVKGLRWAVRVSRDTIQLVVAHSWSVIKAALRPILEKPSRPSRPRYIPEILPPSEVPNCWFQQPTSANWRIARPCVDVMLPEERWLAGI